MGFLCLIGIGHLPDSMSKLRFYRTFDIRPCLSTDLSGIIEETLQGAPRHAYLVTKNLFSAVKLVSQKVINKVPYSGNVQYEDEMIEREEEMRKRLAEFSSGLDPLSSTMDGGLNLNKTVLLDEYIVAED